MPPSCGDRRSRITELRELSWIGGGKLELCEGRVALLSLLPRCGVLVSESARAKRLSIEIDADPGLAPVLCDERKLKQVVVNLLSNAVKFTPPGGHVMLRARVDAPNDLIVTVRDDGVGIAPENLAKAMTPFGQVENALSREHMGTGLGLPLAKQLVELHGGSLGLESTPGLGTTVTIRLPGRVGALAIPPQAAPIFDRRLARSEERRVGTEWCRTRRSWWSPYH